MNCSKLNLEVPHVIIPSDTLPPIPPPFLFKSQYEVNKPSWCQSPNIQLQFEEIGSTKIREIGNESFLLIGRNDRCSIILDDLMVSRCHALLLNTSKGDSYLIDVNSTHGTYLGNHKLIPFVPTLIKKCSIIRFGSIERQYIIREYPKVDDILKKSNICESIEDKEVVLNTFHNITCLSSCTSAITRSLSISKLFSRVSTDSPKENQHDYQFNFNKNNLNNYNSNKNNNNNNNGYNNRNNSLANVGISSSNEDLMSICTSRESSMQSISDLQHLYQLCTENVNGQALIISTSSSSSSSSSSIISSSLITPDSSISQNYFFSLTNNLPPPPLSDAPTIEIDATSVSSSSPSSSLQSDVINSEYSDNQTYPTGNEYPTSSLECPQEPSPEIRKCLRRSFSVDSTTRLVPHNCFYITPTSSVSSHGLSSLNFGRRTNSADMTTSSRSPRLIGSKCHSNGEGCERKRVRFSISEFDLSKHQEGESHHQYESYLKNF